MLFMVEGRAKGAPTPEMMALIPEETARGKELDAQGVRRHFFMAADQTAGWQVLEVASRDELEQVLASFPLRPYFDEKVTEIVLPG